MPVPSRKVARFVLLLRQRWRYCPRSDVWLFGVGGRVVTIDQQAAAADRGWAARTRRRERATFGGVAGRRIEKPPQAKFCRHQSCQRARGKRSQRPGGRHRPAGDRTAPPISRSFCRNTTRWCCTKPREQWAVTKPGPKVAPTPPSPFYAAIPPNKAAAGRSARRAAQNGLLALQGSSGDKLPGPTGQKGGRAIAVPTARWRIRPDKARCRERASGRADAAGMGPLRLTPSQESLQRALGQGSGSPDYLGDLDDGTRRRLARGSGSLQRFNRMKRPSARGMASRSAFCRATIRAATSMAAKIG